MIELKDFSMGFGERKLLNDVSVSFPTKKLTALIGRNGTGKSTLMKAVCGLNKNYDGEILINGENLRQIPVKRLSKIIAYVNTMRPRLANLRCRDVVELGRTPYTSWHGKISKSDKEVVKEAFNLVGMTEYEDRYFTSLSDGESQKIMIARAIAQDTNIILLDEPTSFLDLPTRYDLAVFLQNLVRKNGKTILFSTHELDIALNFCDYIALIDAEKVTVLPSSEMKNSKQLKEAFPKLDLHLGL